MTKKTGITTAARVLGPHDGDVMGLPDGVRDRFMVSGEDSGGRFALVEHLMAPRALAAPLHRHTREDEYSYVLEGRVGALLGEDELVAEVGHLIFKPREQWHTFWNAGDVQARVLEIIAPAGLDKCSARWVPSRASPTRRRLRRSLFATAPMSTSSARSRSSSGTGLRPKG